MNTPVEHSVEKSVDGIQRAITNYALNLNYNALSLEAIHAAKVRIIDTLGALISGFFGASCGIVRNLAAHMPNRAGATVIGTRLKTTLDMAALANGTAARFVELTDSYHWPGAYNGHASDVIMPALAVAEHARVNGREFITGVVLGYEIYLRISDVVPNRGFDHTNFCCLGSAIAAGKLLGLEADQLAHCISMAVVPNNILRQVRLGEGSAWKTVASGQAGRSGVFAALLAKAGMEGPRLPFEGKAGWCNHIAGARFALNTLGGNGTPFKIPYTQIKNRPSSGCTIPAVLAAEKLAPLKNIEKVKEVTVEVYKIAMERSGIGEHHWNPRSREVADHSSPYVVGSTLMDGTLTPRSFNETRLWNPQLRALMQKIKVIENEEFTKAYEGIPQEHRMRVTVVTDDGELLVGETGGDQDDMAAPRSDAQIAEKFRGLTEEVLGTKRVNAILDRLWRLEDMENVAELPPAFVIG